MAKKQALTARRRSSSSQKQATPDLFSLSGWVADLLGPASVQPVPVSWVGVTDSAIRSHRCMRIPTYVALDTGEVFTSNADTPITAEP